MKWIFRYLVGFGSVLATGLLLAAVFHVTSSGKETSPAIRIDSTAIDRSPQLNTSFAPVVKKAAPSVVNIYSTHIIHMRPYRNPFFNDPMLQQFHQFFGDRFGSDNNHEITRRAQSLGSGVVISPDGYILTANHVVEGAAEIKVAIGDNNDDKEYTAQVVGTDPPTDVAVLKIDAKDLAAITFGDSEQLEVGDVVLAIGNPFGLGQSVTMGIISGLGRHYGVNGYENFIQTDAPINRGNSGGALVDAKGRLIGINTWIASSSGGSEGVGFAVPINMVRHVMERLIAGGTVARGYLGILYPQDLTPDLAAGFNLPGQTGALVGDVAAGTPADKAGIKSGDVITEINGKIISDANSLRLAISDLAPDNKTTVKLLHDGREKTVTVVLAALPDPANQGRKGRNNSGLGNAKTDALDGVTVADLEPSVRDQLDFPKDLPGVIVSDLDQDSNAAEAGLLLNDVIVEINRSPVSSAGQAVKLCQQATGNRIMLKIWRRMGGLAGTRFLSVDNTPAR